MASRTVAVLASVIMGLGCSPEPEESRDPEIRQAAPTEAQATSTCIGSDNPIDRAVCARMKEAGGETAPAARATEICRRGGTLAVHQASSGSSGIGTPPRRAGAARQSSAREERFDFGRALHDVVSAERDERL